MDHKFYQGSELDSLADKAVQVLREVYGENIDGYAPPPVGIDRSRLSEDSLLELEEARAEIENYTNDAREVFRDQIEGSANRYRAGEIDQPQFRRESQAGLTRWSEESGINDELGRMRRQILEELEEEEEALFEELFDELIQRLTRQSGTAEDLFPESTLRGTPDERMQYLQQFHPDRIKKVSVDLRVSKPSSDKTPYQACLHYQLRRDVDGRKRSL